MSEQANTKDLSPGIVSWNELASRDPEGSKKFYSALFGWTAETESMGPAGDYTFFSIGDRPAAGLLRMPAEAGPAPTMWLSYITVADLPTAVAKAVKLGAKLCKDVTTIPMGRFAIINDPQGATVGLWEFAKQS